MDKDYSRQQQGYAIIDSPFKDRGGYIIVEALQRDKQGNVLRKGKNMLSHQRSIPEAQKLLDQWEASVGLATQFERWEKVHQDGSSIWGNLVEGNFVEGWHVWSLLYTNGLGQHWCTRCQDYHSLPIEYNMDAQRIPASVCEAVKALQDEEKQ